MKRVAMREEFSDVMARFRINNEDEDETLEDEGHQNEESGTEGGI